ncbi:M24 family metallopeptidase [Salinifilum ghardaiensis]
MTRTSAGESLPGAEADEHEIRLRAVRAAMAERSLSALVVTEPANLYYLTGYDAWSFYTPQCLVVPAEGELQFFTRAMDAGGASAISSLPEEQVHGYPEGLVHRDDAHPFDWVTARARESGALVDSAESLIAVESDSPHLPARAYHALQEGLPRCRFTDSRELVNWVRLVKSEHEIAQLRVAGSIAERAMRVALEGVVAGRRQCDVVAEVMAAQASGTAEHGGDYPAIVPLLPTGDGAGTPHLTWSDRTFVEGEATTVELAGVFRRYHAPVARTVVLGEPPRRLAATAGAVRESVRAALDSLVPGVTGSDVHDACNAVISRHGLSKDSRIGYSIGIGYPPDWGERTVSLRPDEKTVVVPGMAFHIIIGMWMDGWGYELSEPVVVTDSGAERLTDLPQDLTTKR